MSKNKNKVSDKEYEKMVKVNADTEKYVVTNGVFYFSYVLRIAVAFVGIIVIGILAFGCFKKSFSDESTSKLAYSEKASMNYNVSYFPNNPTGLDANGAGEVDSYLSELVDEISTNLIYNYTLDQNVNVKYSYYIDATMELRNMDTSEVFLNNNYSLTDKVEEEVKNTKNVKIEQNVQLDYDYYNDKAKELTDLTSGANVAGNLKIKMYIDLETTYENFVDSIKSQKVIEVKIPLLISQVSASLVDDLDRSNVIEVKTKPELVNKPMLYSGVSLLVLDTMFMLSIISFIFKTTPKKSKYCVLRDGLLEEHDKLIVNVKKMPDIKGHNIIDCYSFSELMDAQKLLNKPIIYYELVKDQKCIFFILDEDIYEFVLKECDIEY